jgi:hypothetical protein
MAGQMICFAAFLYNFKKSKFSMRTLWQVWMTNHQFNLIFYRGTKSTIGVCTMQLLTNRIMAGSVLQHNADIDRGFLARALGSDIRNIHAVSQNKVATFLKEGPGNVTFNGE